ncbi:MAG: DUF58 domain-containing protein [Treponema sp.]|nr:DUF58 domain-containing protein [Treponema sp.]
MPKPAEQRESLLAKANYLKLIAKDLADSMKNGGFSSLYKGQGMEFAGVREYIRGDDVRTIDWNVTARMSHPYIKQYEESRELQVFIILDGSYSMQLLDGKRTKFQAASEASAILALAAELNSCPAGAVLFDGEIYFSCKPGLNKNQTMQLITEMDRLPERQTTGSVLANAIKGAGKLLHSHSLVCIFSDFRASGWEKPLIQLAQKNEVIAFCLQSPADKKLPSIGNALFTDIESGRSQELPSSSEAFQKSYASYTKDKENKWKSFCLSHGVRPVIFDSEKEALGVLYAALNQGGLQ